MLVPAFFPAPVDLPVAREVRTWPEWFVTFADDLTNYGDTWEILFVLVWLVPLVGIAFGRWYWRQALGLALTLLATGLLAIVLKGSIGRGRPTVMFDRGMELGFEPFSFSHAWTSFPSGHAVSAATLATWLAFQGSRRWVPAWVMLALVLGATRVIVKAHWPSDVIAGLCVGVVAARLIIARFGAHPWMRLASLEEPDAAAGGLAGRLRRLRGRREAAAELAGSPVSP